MTSPLLLDQLARQHRLDLLAETQDVLSAAPVRPRRGQAVLADLVSRLAAATARPAAGREVCCP